MQARRGEYVKINLRSINNYEDKSIEYSDETPSFYLTVQEEMWLNATINGREIVKC